MLSVCNRQPVRVYAITNKSIIEKALKLQGGFNGYKVPPALFLITADNEAFLSISEHNEGFVDGGPFSPWPYSWLWRLIKSLHVL